MPKHAKRKYTTATDESDLDGIVVAHHPKRVRTIRVLSTVCIWRPIPTTIERDQVFPATPSAKRVIRKESTPQQSPAKLLHERRVGPPIQLSPEKIAKIPAGYTSPPNEEVHLQQIGGLFFRFWNEDSQGKNSESGFIAGRYAACNVTWAEPPGLEKIDPADIWNHINPVKNRAPWPSPFISVSNFFPWALRNALKSAKSGATDLRISVIQAARLDERAVFYSQPLVKELKKLYPFTEGAHRYQGPHEFLIYNEIPAKAILHTFRLEDFLNFTNRDPTLAKVLQLNVLGMRGNYRTTISEMLGSARVQINGQLATDLARICVFVGLTPASSAGNLSSMICDVVKGWKFVLKHKQLQLWRNLADRFAHAFVVSSEEPVSISGQLNLQLGFLDGMRWANGDFNCWFHKISALQMQRKADTVGLHDPATMILDGLKQQLAATHFKIDAHRRDYRRLLHGHSTRGLLTEGQQ